MDEYENIRSIGKNVAIVVPHQQAAGYIPPSLEIEESDILGSGSILPMIRAQGSLKEGHQYAVTFGVDTIAVVSGYENGFQYVTDEILIYDITDSVYLAYTENSNKYIGTNLVLNDVLDGVPNYWTLNPLGSIETDVFDGLQIKIDDYIEIPEFSYGQSGWVNGNGIMLSLIHI